jgi:hypothetical protein
VCCGFASVEPCPSPNTQPNVTGSPFGSKLPELEKLTFSGAAPSVGVPSAFATGGVLPTTPV